MKWDQRVWKNLKQARYASASSSLAPTFEGCLHPWTAGTAACKSQAQCASVPDIEKVDLSGCTTKMKFDWSWVGTLNNSTSSVHWFMHARNQARSHVSSWSDDSPLAQWIASTAQSCLCLYMLCHICWQICRRFFWSYTDEHLGQQGLCECIWYSCSVWTAGDYALPLLPRCERFYSAVMSVI